MSGIFGILGRVGVPFDACNLRNMSDALIHRGPDDYRLWQKDHVGLGHRMLRATPEADGELLPYHDQETGLVITSDARLDNREELIEKLGRNIFKMDLVPDSQIILQAYYHWNSECLQHLVGDFSFAVWDERAHSLFCARDHLGVKPFYYYFEDTTFIFCSESEVIAKYSGIEVSINKPRFADYLTPHLEGLDKISTCYQKIFRLPPAHFLEITPGEMSQRQYWEPQPSEPFELQSDGDYQEALTEILKRSVAARCRGIDNPAVLLSGGVDSAAILGFTRLLCKNNIVTKVHSYSGISENPSGCKESHMIQKLVENGGFEHHFYTPERLKDLSDRIFPLIEKIQEPFDFSMVLIFLLYQQASEAGNRVVLDGVDGDMVASLSSGYPIDLLRQGLFATALRETMNQGKGIYKNYSWWPHLFCRYMLSAWSPLFLKQKRWELQLKSRLKEYVMGSQIDSTFAKRAGLEERLEQFERDNRKEDSQFPSAKYLSNVQHPFLVVGMERYDRVASLCSVEPRHPFANKQLVDFYSSLPWNQVVRKGWSKFLLRKVVQKYIPSKVAWRLGNEHLGGEFTNSFLSYKKEVLEKIVQKEKRELEKYIKSQFLLHSSSNNGYFTGSKETAMSSEVVGLAMWLKRNKEK